ncbi:hypothetical protein BJX70DRAFT_245281 [Aspergillus crustosus]
MTNNRDSVEAPSELEASRGFLSDITPVIPHYTYRGKEQFLADFDHAMYTSPSEWCLITAVDPQTFAKVFPNSHDKDCPFSRWCAYDKQLERLLVRTMTHSEHQMASRAFYDMVMEAVTAAGMRRKSLRAVGTTTYGDRNMGHKEADEAWVPTRLPRGHTRLWPTAVLEIAFSETASKLRADVRYWSRASGGDVRTVFTLEIYEHAARIILEKWENDGDGHGHHRRQRIEITRRNNGQITVSEAPLTIDFEKLFLRPPEGPQEQRIEMNAVMLQELAEYVWDEQDRKKAGSGGGGLGA